jgi:hypothetical protein
MEKRGVKKDAKKKDANMRLYGVFNDECCRLRNKN